MTLLSGYSRATFGGTLALLSGYSRLLTAYSRATLTPPYPHGPRAPLREAAPYQESAGFWLGEGSPPQSLATSSRETDATHTSRTCNSTDGSQGGSEVCEPPPSEPAPKSYTRRRVSGDPRLRARALSETRVHALRGCRRCPHRSPAAFRPPGGEKSELAVRNGPAPLSRRDFFRPDRFEACAPPPHTAALGLVAHRPAEKCALRTSGRAHG